MIELQPCRLPESRSCDYETQEPRGLDHRDAHPFARLDAGDDPLERSGSGHEKIWTDPYANVSIRVVSVDATYNGLSGTSNPANFTVQ